MLLLLYLYPYIPAQLIDSILYEIAHWIVLEVEYLDGR